MLTVIIGHCVNFWTGTWFTVLTPLEEAYPLKLLSELVNAFHIYAFALVSGFLFCYLRTELGKYQNFTMFCVTKAKRLLIPYVFICLIWVIPVAIYFNHYSGIELIKRYVLGTNPNQLWFLLMLFWVFMFAWPLSNIFCKHVILSGGIVLGFYCVGVVGNHFIPNVYCIWTGCEYLLFFWIGFQMYNKNDLFRRIPAFLWDAVFAVLFCILTFTQAFGMISSILTIVLHITGAIGAFATLQWIALKINWKNSKVFLFLAKRSMPIYLFHQQVIYFVIFWLNGKVNPYVNAAANFVIAMAVSVLISSILMKFKVTRFLIGEK